MNNVADVAETDPRLEQQGTAPEHGRPAYVDDRDISFTEHQEHAARSRAYEEDQYQARRKGGHVSPLGTSTVVGDSPSEKNEKTGALTADVANLSPEQKEMINARRALRSAGWASVFYLITTDILGPFNAPYAISQTGFVAGVILYVIMGIFAVYGGLLLWYVYLKLDSDMYPIKTYADMGRRVLGRGFANLVNIMQSVQLIVNVGTICLSNGQSLSQISKGHLCFAVCIVIWAFVGMVIGQIRTLKNYGWLANFAVWINLLLIFISMGFIAHSPPNYASAVASYGPDVASGPVKTAAFVSLPLWAKMNGVMNMVFAYGGAMIFPEIMAEMRRPWDFWKGAISAQLLIFLAYMMYGVFVYVYQGQYTLGLAYTGVSKYSWQTVGNVMALITGIIAAGLYGNIGIKVAYYTIVEGMFRGPPLLSKAGSRIWIVMVIVYWSLAFIIGSAIPQVQTISGLIGAVAVMHFTYTFPPLFVFAYLVRVDGLAADGAGFSYSRGMFGGGIRRLLFKWVNIVFFLGALALSALGMYGSGTAIYETFKVSAATSFGCSPPV